MLPTNFGAGLVVDLAGIESLLGGLAGLSLPERSRTPTLLLTLDAGLPLKMVYQSEFTFSTKTNGKYILLSRINTLINFYYMFDFATKRKKKKNT